MRDPLEDFEDDEVVENCPDCFYGFHWRPGPFGELTMYLCGTCDGRRYVVHEEESYV